MEFSWISEAYRCLTEGDSVGQVKEFAPNWANIINEEHSKASADAVVSQDANKPSIAEFFITLQRRLYQFKLHLQNAKPNPFIAAFENISEKQQSKNIQYAEKCLAAAQQIAALLQEHVNTSSKKHWTLTEEARKVALRFRLLEQFNVFGEDHALEIRDAYSFELNMILCEFFVFLRNPLNNFKSTEDLYHLNLLDDVAPEIRDYHNRMLENASYDDSIEEKLREPQETLRAFSEDKKEDELKEARAVVFRGVRKRILAGKEYVLSECLYPDNVDIFDPHNSEVFPLEIRAQFRRIVISSMFEFNRVLKDLAIDDVEPFYVDLTGYETLDEFKDEDSQIYSKAYQEGTSARLIPITGQKFIEANGAKTTPVPLMLKATTQNPAGKAKDKAEEADSEDPLVSASPASDAIPEIQLAPWSEDQQWLSNLHAQFNAYTGKDKLIIQNLINEVILRNGEKKTVIWSLERNHSLALKFLGKNLPEIIKGYYLEPLQEAIALLDASENVFLNADAKNDFREKLSALSKTLEEGISNQFERKWGFNVSKLIDARAIAFEHSKMVTTLCNSNIRIADKKAAVLKCHHNSTRSPLWKTALKILAVVGIAALGAILGFIGGNLVAPGPGGLLGAIAGIGTGAVWATATIGVTATAGTLGGLLGSIGLFFIPSDAKWRASEVKRSALESLGSMAPPIAASSGGEDQGDESTPLLVGSNG